MYDSNPEKGINIKPRCIVSDFTNIFFRVKILHFPNQNCVEMFPLNTYKAD